MLLEIIQTLEAIGTFLFAIAVTIACMPLWPIFGLATALWLTDRKSSPLFIS
ncbi:MAG: hypothetical protein QY323_05850 [Patescibacteria group bacterium]|nr:MAG: hypothetical protein QY323_05850 [Patescibacteria group bacterium]